MVNEKLIEIWKRKAREGEVWAIEKLKQNDEAIPKPPPVKKGSKTKSQNERHEKVISFRIDEPLHSDLKLFMSKMNYKKNQKSDLIRKIIADYLEPRIRKLGFEPLTFGNPLNQMSDGEIKFKLREEQW